MTDIVCSTIKTIENTNTTLSIWNYNSNIYFIDDKNMVYDYNTIEKIGIKDDNILWKYLEYL
jgi:hypothetical protein